LTSNPRVRFAPSPTGLLHIGGARTALYNWAFARHHGGTFVLRIEDTDPTRSTQENTDAILRSLRWLGLEWDEGPEVGGDFGPYFQTLRMDTYHAAFEKMRERGAVYPCFCPPELIAEKRAKAEKEQGGYAGYDRTCRDIPADEAAARIAAGEPHCWRLKVPLDHEDIVVEDAVRGECRFPIDAMDDMIVVRTDGTPTYNFAVVCDDANMKITHVIRGDDHLSNTPRQVLIYEALGLPVPQFAHLSMIWGPDGKKLSKRHGATGVEEYREQGYLPDAIVNYLALLGWSLDGQTTKFDRKTLCENFSLEHVSKNPAIFDFEKLDWLNGEYLRAFTPDEFLEHMAPELVSAGLCTERDVQEHRDWFLKIRPLVFERVKKFNEIPAMVAYLFSGSEVPLDERSVSKVLKKEGAREALEAAHEALSDPELAWNTEAIEATLREIPEKLDTKARKVFQPIRVAVCGNMVSPPLFESLELLDRADVLARIEKAERVCA
jgi:glutamyl-tRNA synthetase